MDVFLSRAVAVDCQWRLKCVTVLDSFEYVF